MLTIFHKCSAVAEVGDRLATIDIVRKLGGLSPFWEGGAGSPAAWAEAYLRTK